MWFRLAKEVFHCTVEEAQEITSSAEFTMWTAYYNAEPFGYEIENFRAFESTASVVNQVAATIPRKRGVSVKPKKASDYYPVTTKKTAVVVLTPEQQEHIEKKHGKRRNRKR